MVDAIVWWLVLLALGAIALPITLSLFKNLPDRGYPFSKALALLLLSYLLWIGGSAHIISNTRPAVIALAILIGAISYVIFRRRREEILDFLYQKRRLILSTEAIFLVIFVGFALIRAYDPDINHTEQPMDLAMLNAVTRADHFPPEDPWLSGHSVSYYYFGYLMNSTPAKLTGVSPSVSFNLGLATIPALAATAAFSLVFNLVQMTRQRNGVFPSPSKAMLFGVIGAIFLVILGNLEGILELVRSNGLAWAGFWDWVGINGLEGPVQSTSLVPSESWWWWRATRVIGTVVNGQNLDPTINEFPFFSFLLGDLHPHVMSLPFVLLALALGLNLFRSKDVLGLEWIKRRPLEALILAISLGALGFLNSWDILIYIAVFTAIVLVHSLLQEHGKDYGGLLKGIVPFVGVIVMGAALLYLPFWLGFRTQVSGISLVREFGTRPLHFFIFWGPLFLVPIAFLLIQLGDGVKVRRLAKKGIFWSILIPAIPLILWVLIELILSGREGNMVEGLRTIGGRTLVLIPLLAILSGILFLIVKRVKETWGGEERGGPLFVLILLFFAFLLIMGAELFFVRDVFNNRMNTVFKFYYQGWALLAIASAYGIYYWLSYWQGATLLMRSARYATFSLVALLFLGASFYPFAAAYSKTSSNTLGPTLDGLAYLRREVPGEYEAIQWLRSEVDDTAVIVEAVCQSQDGRLNCGDYYLDENRNFARFGGISAQTGLPTPLGWPGHERQWGRSGELLADRAGDVMEVYTTNDIERARELLERYNATYVYVGRLERSRYGVEDLGKFALFMDTVFYNDSVIIYKVKDE